MPPPSNPDESLAKLAPSKPERFQASDFIAAAIVFLITLGVYIATLAPSVTLEDSGELITAATKFGVPHPPGYPTWTMSGFIISHLVPYGSLAWRMNLQSALFAAAANMVLTLLFCHSGRWLLQRWTEPEVQSKVRRYVFYSGLLVGLTIGFSDVMWSQAVISAVHGTLNALFVNLVLLLFYLWMLEPQKTHRLIWAVFVFALGLTNHHTLIQIIPAFLHRGVAIPVRAGKFWSVFLAVNLFSLSILVYLSWLSGDDQNGTPNSSAIAMAWLIFLMTALVSFFYLKEFRPRLFLLGARSRARLFRLRPLPDEGRPKRTSRRQATPFRRWIPASGKCWWLQGLVANARAGRRNRNAVALLMLALAARWRSACSSPRGWTAAWSSASSPPAGSGLMPYAYEPLASSTHPPMNWGFASERSGFYYSVSRQQYPKALPNLIKSTFGKLVGVVRRMRSSTPPSAGPIIGPRSGSRSIITGTICRVTSPFR